MSFTATALKLVGPKLGALVSKLSLNWFRRGRAGQRALDGGDWTTKGSLAGVVVEELAALSRHHQRPASLRTEQATAWLLRPETAAKISSVLTAKLASDRQLEQENIDQLTPEFEHCTGESGEQALGSINAAVDFVYERLRATEDGTQALQLALAARGAVRAAMPARAPVVDIQGRANAVRACAGELLAAARFDRQVPPVLGGLGLEEIGADDDATSTPTSLVKLRDALNSGSHLILFGEGGIGKTTLLLELAGEMLASPVSRIPLFIDAATWAANGRPVLEYVAATNPFRAHSVTVDDLAQLAMHGHLTIAVNGWNELPATAQTDTLRRFGELTTTTPSVSVVLATRSSKDSASLRSAKLVQVKGLSWPGQARVIRSELDVDRAQTVVDRLARDNQLRYAARSPLVLRGLIEQARRGEISATCVMDLLGAVVRGYERDGTRQALLGATPLRGHHRDYLEALAWTMAEGRQTTLARPEALTSIAGAGRNLQALGQIGALPDPTEVVDALCNQHLLFADEQRIRFVHQRFQEFFTATVLLKACDAQSSPTQPDVLRAAVDQPFFEDALLLVAGKLRTPDGATDSRTRLIGAAASCDVGFACDLAGACAFTRDDDATLFDQLVAAVKSLCASPLTEVAQFGRTCMVASELDVFAEYVWPGLESDEQQVRLTTYRLCSDHLSLRQLGPDAETRIASWPPDRRAEAIHELARNPDNYGFIVRSANEEPDTGVRVAAISSLRWNYPASNAALAAWQTAPPAVQLEHEALAVVETALQDGEDSEGVTAQLLRAAQQAADGDTRLRLALEFPNLLGELGGDAVFERLRGEPRHGIDAPLVVLASRLDPQRLTALAQDLALSQRGPPDWAERLLLEAPASVQANVFASAWGLLHDREDVSFSASTIGPLANHEQTLCGVTSWIQHLHERRSERSPSAQERERQLGYLLANAPGDHLLGAVMKLGAAADYEESRELLQLVSNRIGETWSRSRDRQLWLPSSEEVGRLVDVFGTRNDSLSVPQHAVQAMLCSIASRVAPDEFGAFILEGFGRHLDAWSTYARAQEAWVASGPTGPRPTNPHFGNYLLSAVGHWGFRALPGLLKLMDHPQADKLLYEAVARVVAAPWDLLNDDHFRSTASDLKEGARRQVAGRAHRQPNDVEQGLTDEVARRLGAKLNELVSSLNSERTAQGDKWNGRQAEYRVRGLLSALARVPSKETTAPLMAALVSDHADGYGIVGALRSHVRNGGVIDSAKVAHRLEEMCEHFAESRWLDDSARHQFSELHQLLYLVTPTSLLRTPLGDHLEKWLRHTHTSIVIRELGALGAASTWPILMRLARPTATAAAVPEELLFSLASALSIEHFPDFLCLITDGTLFALARTAWNLERIAGPVARVIGTDATRLSKFLAVCKGPATLAQSFASAVLSAMPDNDAARIRFGLDALDGGDAGDDHMSAYAMLRRMFRLNVPMDGEGQYEVHPIACNELRTELFNRATRSGPATAAAKRLLARVETLRREGGRPSDEPRHPDSSFGRAWTDALFS